MKERARAGLNVNGIYRELVTRKFSRNKKLIITAINDLEKGNLIDTIKNRRATKRKKLKQEKTKILIQLGDEFVRLADDLEDYTKSCIKLQNVIKQYFDVRTYDDKKILRNVLLNRGWKPKEIDMNDALFRSTKHLCEDLISPFQIINTILIRYIMVLSKISNDNKNAKAILDDIVMDSINKQLSNTTAIDTDNTNLIKEKIGFVTDLLEGKYYGNRFTNNEVDDVLSSILSVLDVPLDVLKSTIENIRLSTEYDLDLGPLSPPEGCLMWEFDCQYLIQHKINEKYGFRFELSNLRLGAAHILESKIPPQIKRGSPVNVFVKINGDTKHAFLNILIVDPDNKQLWYHDPSTWDSSIETGTLNLTHQEHASEWIFTIPSDRRLGEYKALILLYEVKLLDKELKVKINDNRHILDFEEKTFYVTT